MICAGAYHDRGTHPSFDQEKSTLRVDMVVSFLLTFYRKEFVWEDTRYHFSSNACRFVYMDFHGSSYQSISDSI